MNPKPPIDDEANAFVDVEVLIDQVADEFLAAGRMENPPKIDDFIGSHPLVIKNPTIQQPLRRMLETIQIVDQIHESPIQPLVKRSPDFGPQQAFAEQAFPEIDDYDLHRVAGCGGMGVVYQATQQSLSRKVALKVLPERLFGAQQALARFQFEARAAAQLHHTNIVPVFEVGNDGKHCFYAMQFIEGHSLSEVIGQLRFLRDGEPIGSKQDLPDTELGPGAQLTATALSEADQTQPVGVVPDRILLSSSDTEGDSCSNSTLSVSSTTKPFFRNVARIGRQVADGLQHAHERGIVHRDIKPSNLILDPEGVAWITDFGLAKTEEADLTCDGDVVGTLRYMPPERFQGKCDARSDVYSLGVTLYETLALQSPFAAHDRIRLISAIQQDSPAPLRTLDHRIPRDLQTIVDKAMEKKPRRRYPTAAAMADDLDRFLDGRPIRARRVGAFERLWLWSKNNVALATSIASIAAILVLSLVLVTWQAVRARAAEKLATAEADRAMVAEAEAVQERETAQEMLAKSQCDLAQREFERGRFVESQRIIDEISERFRDSNWRFLNDHARDFSNQIIFPDERRVSDLRFLHYRKRFVAMNQSIGVVELSGERIGRWQPARGRSDARFGIDAKGDKIAFPISKKDVAVMSVSTGEILHRWRCDLESVDYVILSPDGITAIAKDKNKLIAYTVESGKPLWEHANSEVMPAFSPDSHAVAVSVKVLGSDNRYKLEVQLLETGNGNVLRTFKAPGNTRLRTHLQFLTSLGKLAWYGVDEIVVLNVKDGTIYRTLNFHDEKVMTISPRGDLIATTKGNRIRLWSMTTGRHVRSLNGAVTPAVAIAFMTNNKMLVSSHKSSENSSIINVWPIRLSEMVAETTLRTQSKRTGVAFDSSGARVYIHSGGRFACMSIENSTIEWTRDASGSWHDDFAIHPRDDTLVLRLPHERTLTHLTSTGETLPAFGRVTYSSVAFDRRGERLLVVDNAFNRQARGGTNVRVLSYLDGEVLQKIDDHVSTLATFCQDDTVIASAALAGGIRLWDCKAGTPIRQIDASDTGSISCLAASPDGSRLATGGSDCWIRIWDPATGKIQTGFRAHWESVRCLKFSPDGREIVSGSDLGVVRIHDVETGKEKLALYGLYAPVGGVAFSPNGKRIAAICKEGNLKVWDRRISMKATAPLDK